MTIPWIITHLELMFALSELRALPYGMNYYIYLISKNKRKMLKVACDAVEDEVSQNVETIPKNKQHVTTTNHYNNGEAKVLFLITTSQLHDTCTGN